MFFSKTQASSQGPFLELNSENAVAGHLDNAVVTMSANPALERLKLISDRLDADQKQALMKLELCEIVREAMPSNHILFGITDKDELRSDAAPGLTRRASFLLSPTITNEIGAFANAVIEQEPIKKISDEARELITAQVTAIRQNIDATNIHAIDDARTGKRFCPLTLHPTKFSHFLDSQVGTIGAIVAACKLSNEHRNINLKNALTDFSRAYLSRDHITVSLISGDESSSDFGYRVYERYAAISIGLGELVKANVLPSKNTTSAAFASDFDSASTHGIQAGVFLQKLLTELVDVEAQFDASNSVTKKGKPMGDQAIASQREFDYRGSIATNDSLEVSHYGIIDPGGNTQRSLGIDTMVAAFLVNEEYARHHSAPMFTDPETTRWLGNPRFAFDTASMHNPSSRLKVAPVGYIAAMLLKAGLDRN